MPQENKTKHSNITVQSVHNIELDVIFYRPLDVGSQL